MSTSSESEELSQKQPKEQLLEELKEQLLRHLKRKESKILRSLTALTANVETCRQWRDLQHEGLLLQAFFYRLQPGMEKISVEDWEQEGQERTLVLDPTIPLSENVSQRFNQSRRLKRGLKSAEKVLSHQYQLLEQVRQEQANCLQTQSVEELAKALESFTQTVSHQKKETSRRLPYRAFKSAAGISIWVGRGAKENHNLTFHLAKGSNWWFHVEGSPGAHVIARTNRGEEPDQETIQDALQLALLFSGLREKIQATVVSTQCKYIRPLGRNQPGRVTIAKEKRYNVEADSERLEAIKERKLKQD